MKKKYFLLIVAAVSVFTACESSNDNGDVTTSVPPTSVNATTETETVTNEAYVGNINVAEVTDYFSKVKQILDEDDGELWGSNLYTRIMVVDTTTNYFVANRQNASGTLKESGEVFIGQLDADTNTSNSTMEYDGENWTTVCYYSGMLEDDMECLYIHEMFHNNQADLGLFQEDAAPTKSGTYYANTHMDDMDARILLRLEWQALYKAYGLTGDERLEAIKAAIVFRNARRNQYDSTEDENRFEIHEGMPEYTGMKLTYTEDEVDSYLSGMFGKYNTDSLSSSLVRSFAYLSGPLYGILLDEYSEDWRNEISYNSDLGAMLEKATGISTLALMLKILEKIMIMRLYIAGKIRETNNCRLIMQSINSYL